MHLQSCEHPRRIFNKYLNEYVWVPCRKCHTCRNAHAAKWIDRLVQESRCHKYTFMIYLDFNNRCLPKMKRYHNPQDNEWYLLDYNYLNYEELNRPDGLRLHCIPFKDLSYLSKPDWDYFQARLKHKLGLPYCDTRILQLFNKRLNKIIHDEITHRYSNFRYFYTYEIGPTTHRPHVHGLFWCDDLEVAEKIEYLFSKAWRSGHLPIGSCSTRPVSRFGNAASYVAQYINCFYDLPEIYSEPKLRPKHIFSKSPAIGSLLESTKEIYETFDLCSPLRVVCNPSKPSEICTSPLLPSFENRLFPKIARYGRIPAGSRTELYGLTSGRYEGHSESFLNWFNYVRNKDFIRCIQTDFCVFPAIVPRKGARLDSTSIKYLSEISEGFKETTPLLNHYRICNRVREQAKSFGVTLPDYVNHIERYYDNRSLLSLKNMYTYQSEELDSSDDIPYMYPEYVYQLNHGSQIQLDVGLTDDYRQMVATSKEIYEKSTKTQRKNAYFESLKVKDSSLYCLIKSFYYAKECNETLETLA